VEQTPKKMESAMGRRARRSVASVALIEEDARHFG
jgi:hypothetical protein